MGGFLGCPKLCRRDAGRQTARRICKAQTLVIGADCDYNRLLVLTPPPFPMVDEEGAAVSPYLARFCHRVTCPCHLVLSIRAALQSSPHRGCTPGDIPGVAHRRARPALPGNGALTDRDGRFTRWWEDRRLFQYRFEGHTAGGILNRAASEQVNSIVSSPALRTLHTPPARLLRSWNAEGWYIVLRDERLLAFTTENRMAPPHEITDLLREIENLPTHENGHGPVQDICLGLCYGPVAALGFWYPNQPCFKLTSGTTECR